MSFCLWQIGLLLYVFVVRMAYPIDLEWMEGGSLCHAYQMLHGMPIYGEPGALFAPYPYPPVHASVLAVVGLIDLDFWSGRLVSVLAFSALCVVLWREVHLHLDGSSVGAAFGALAVATIVEGYPITGQWYDLIRVDTLMMALSVLGAGLISGGRHSNPRLFAAAVVFTAAIYTKQTAALFVAWICLFVLVRRPLAGVRLGALTLFLCLAALALLQWQSDGHFWFWVFENVRSHPFDSARSVEGLEKVLEYLPFLPMAPLLFLVSGPRGWLRPRTVLWTGMLVMAVPVSLLPYAKEGGYLNNLLPLVVLTGPVFIMIVGDLFAARWRGAGLVRWAALIAASAFVAVHSLEAGTYLPTEPMRRAAVEFNDLVASLEGGVVVPQLCFMPVRNGHRSSPWHLLGHLDLEVAGQPVRWAQLLQISGARWAMLDSRDWEGWAQTVRRHFRRVGALPRSTRVRMITGYDVRVDELWERPGGRSGKDPQ